MQFIPCLNNVIALQYNRLLTIAKNISGKKDIAADLLHHVVISMYQNSEINNICSRGEIEKYCIAAMRTAFTQRSSSFWRQQEIKHRADLADIPEHQNTDHSGRIFNENADSLISRLPEIETELMRLYSLPGFSAQELSQETGIPIDYIYKRIETAKRKLRRYVNSGQA